MAKVEYAKANKKPNFFVRTWDAIKNFFVDFGKRFVDGSIGTKLSHFIFGAGNFYHGQIIKGFLFLILQVGIILFMVLCPEINGTPYGWKALVNLQLGGQEVGTEFNPETGTRTPPTDDNLRLLFGIVTIAVIIIYFIVWYTNIKSSFKADLDVKQGKKASSFKQDCSELLDSKFHILMLTPTMIAALIFTILPTVFMICIAFTSYNVVDMSATDTPNLFYWTGVKNFVDMFAGSSQLAYEIQGRFIPVLVWTIIWAILATVTCYFGGILLAILINKKGLKFKKVFRTFFVISIAVPQFISLLAVRSMFNSVGPINTFLQNIGLINSPIVFFGGEGGNEYVAKVMVVIINMWLGIPYTMLMTSGILMNIPADLYEAATIDGASKTKMFWKVTLPYVIFVTTPYLISSFIGNINSFNTIFLLTGGRPVVEDYQAGGTDLLVTWLYKLTIEAKQYNTGAVIGIITFIITSVITLIAYTNSKAYKEEDTFQ